RSVERFCVGGGALCAPPRAPARKKLTVHSPWGGPKGLCSELQLISRSDPSRYKAGHLNDIQELLPSERACRPVSIQSRGARHTTGRICAAAMKLRRCASSFPSRWTQASRLQVDAWCRALTLAPQRRSARTRASSVALVAALS